MSCASGLSDLTEISSNKLSSSPIDNYNPNDLIVSWTKFESKTEGDALKLEQPHTRTVDHDGVFLQGAPKRGVYKPSRRILIAISVVLLMVIIAMVTAIIVMVSRDDSSATTSLTAPPISSLPPISPAIPTAPSPLQPPSSSPEIRIPTLTPTNYPTSTASPTSAEVAELFNFLSDVSFDSGLALSNTTSNPYMAFKWLAQDDNLTDYSDEQVVQRFVLATLFYSMNGNNWVNNTGWLSTNNECQWLVDNTATSGIATCDSDKSIIEIDLSSNNLEGTIPPELALLSDSLLHLDLYGNNIHGTIPAELALLGKLEVMDLRNNHVTGEIPSSMVDMENLQELMLKDNELKGFVPPFINVRILTASNNWLTGTVPSTFSTKLEILDLANNSLTQGIPQEIESWTALKVLDLSYNLLTESIPPQLGFLVDLEELYLNSNNLTNEIPTEMGLLSNLVKVELQDNDVTGGVPVCNLSSIQVRVDCAEVLCTCCSSTCFVEYIQGISFDGGQALMVNATPQRTALDWLSEDPNLQRYSLKRVIQRYALATFYYSISSEGWTDDVEFLDKEKHECSWGIVEVEVLPIVGARASSIENRDHNARMAIDGDMSTRWASERSDPQWISLDLGKEYRLHSVELDWEEAYGSKYRIEVSSNGEDWQTVFTQLLGVGGTDVIRLSNVEGRYVRMYGINRGTNFGYSLYEATVEVILSPESCDQDDSLVQIDLQKQNIAMVQLPPELALLSESLQLLRLSGNQIAGSIPSEYGRLSRLTKMDLSSNLLTGTLFTEIGGMSSLESLLLNANTLSGTIPSQLGKVDGLGEINLKDNALSGTMPYDVCYLGYSDAIFVDCQQVDCDCCDDCWY